MMKTAKNRTRLPLKALTVLLLLGMVLCLLPTSAWAAGTFYVYGNGIDDESDFELSDGEYVSASSLGATWGDAEIAGADCTIVVDSDVTYSQRLQITSSGKDFLGDGNAGVTLVLRNGCTLTATKGIEVTGGGQLWIYVEAGAKSGKLLVTSPDAGKAGIDVSGTSLEVYGATVTVTGGAGAPGISADTVEVEKLSKVSATGSGSGAGVYASTIYAQSGTLTAKGGVTGKAVEVSTTTNFTDLQKNAVNFAVTSGQTHPTYTVTFNSNGGSSVASQTVNGGYAATEPAAPTKADDTFSGWKLNGSAYSFSTPVTGNITLTAAWASDPVSPGGSGSGSESSTGSSGRNLPNTASGSPLEVYLYAGLFVLASACAAGALTARRKLARREKEDRR